jgi:hypothetical protein
MVVNPSMQQMKYFRLGPTKLLDPFHRVCMHNRVCKCLKPQEYSNAIKGNEMEVLEIIMEVAKDNETYLRNNSRSINISLVSLSLCIDFTSESNGGRTRDHAGNYDCRTHLYHMCDAVNIELVLGINQSQSPYLTTIASA